VERCSMVLNETPKWMQNLLEGELGNLVAKVPGATAQTKKQSRPGTYCPHTEGDLVSLVTLAESVAWMEDEFPEEFLKARDSEWGVSLSLPTRTAPPKQ
jgi:hypothetical protein